MILTLLSFMDVLGGLVLLLKLPITPVKLFFALFIGTKSFLSLLSGISHGHFEPLAVLLGLIDLIAAIAFFVSIFVPESSFVWTGGVLFLLKGLYCFSLSWGW